MMKSKRSVDNYIDKYNPVEIINKMGCALYTNL